MMRAIRLLAFLVLLLPASAPTCAHADENSALEAFKHDFIAATNGDDPAALTALEVPNPQAGQEEYAPFVQWQLQKDLELKVPDNANFILKPADGAMFAGLGFEYPVTPTHTLQIDFNKSEFSSMSILRELYYDAQDDKFLVVAPLPNQMMLEQMAR